MEEKKLEVRYKEYKSPKELNSEEQSILQKSVEVAENAYAPYSKFRVGAVVLFEDGNTFIGSNQENSAYPSGLCAERVAIFAASAKYPNKKIKSIAIFAADSKRSGNVISPCGSCRQVISEYEQKQDENIKILLMNSEQNVWEFPSIESLLPFSFRLIVHNH